MYVFPEFYYGIVGKRISPDAIIRINTIRNILGRGHPNDVSFEVDGKLIVLVEHQSTIDASIAYRTLHFTITNNGEPSQFREGKDVNTVVEVTGLDLTAVLKLKGEM